MKPVETSPGVLVTVAPSAAPYKETRWYELEIEHRDDFAALRVASVFEHAARCLRAQAAGTGPTVTHQRECYGGDGVVLRFAGDRV